MHVTPLLIKSSVCDEKVLPHFLTKETRRIGPELTDVKNNKQRERLKC